MDDPYDMICMTWMGARFKYHKFCWTSHRTLEGKGEKKEYNAPCGFDL
jgi:hypothetical protein